jgi:3-hydroxybutyryl-CoA dehydrogenase
VRAASVERIAVLGAGTMGAGIAQVFLGKGYAVTLIDVDRGALERAGKAIRVGLERWAEKGKMRREEAESARGRLRIASDLEGAGAADFFIEAVVEDLAVKRELFGALGRLAPPEAVIASNTSSLSITELGAASGRPERVIGMHFMNPVPVMELVEVIRGQLTSDATHELTIDLARALDKTPVSVEDYPGFVSNRVLMPFINEAIYCLMEGIAGRDDIDAVFQLGMKHPLGPLALADLIGLDVCLHVMEVLHRGLGDSKYRPCPLLRRMVAAGLLGKKSGQGFYDHGL